MRQASTVKRTTTKSVKSKNRLETSMPQTSSVKEDLNQRIAEVAYQLYVSRGCEHGHDVEDWAKAEQIVKGA